MCCSRFLPFGIILAFLAAVVESGSKEPYDPLRLQATEDRAQAINMDDASAILDIVHDDTSKMQVAARSDRILSEARADLWRKDQDKKNMAFMKTMTAQQRTEDAIHERERAKEEASWARKTMAEAAKKKVMADIRLSNAEKRVDDADVHIEEALAKKEAAKMVNSSPLAKLHTYHAPLSAAATARLAVQNKRADAEEREEEAMAFVRADKAVKGSDHYKVAASDDSQRKPSPGEVEAEEDQKEAQKEMSDAMASAGQKVRDMVTGPQ